MVRPELYRDVPPARAERVEQVLRAALGGAPDAVSFLRASHSAGAVYVVAAGGRRYVLKLFGDGVPLAKRARDAACARGAARLGIAPRLVHADPEGGITIVAYVDGTPMNRHPSPAPEALRSLGDALRRLHAGPVFPAWISVLDLIEGMFHAVEPVEARLPETVRWYLQAFRRIPPALVPHLISAPCHNDLNPTNILAGGERVWLIDWELGCMGDPFFDLATVLNYSVPEPDAEAFVELYLGRRPIPAERFKLELMRQVALCFAGLNLVAASLGVAPELPPDRPWHTLAEANRASTKGELRLDTSDGKLIFGLALLDEARTMGASASCAAALRGLA